MRRTTSRPRRRPPARRPAPALLRSPGAAGAIARFATLAAFYGEDPRRAASREVDVGLWWREAEGDALHRAAWVTATGELYAVRLGPAQDAQPAVELLGAFADEAAVQAALDGWRERCGEPGSLAWLRARAAAALRAPGSDAPARAAASGAARSVVAREPVVGDRLPWRRRAQELAVFEVDAGIAIERPEPRRDLGVAERVAAEQRRAARRAEQLRDAAHGRKGTQPIGALQ
jgi:hypothetical protein